MENNAFEKWCRDATRQIRYRPDREQVRAELMAHLEDHRDAFAQQGLPEHEATERALAAMGDPKEIAPALGKIHRPFWGYCYTVAKAAAIGLCIIALLLAWEPVLSTLEQLLFRPHAPEELVPTDNGAAQALVRDDRTQAVYAEGYLFLLSDGTLWETENGCMVTAWLDIVNCRFTGRSGGVGTLFEATDSHGTEYGCHAYTWGRYNDRVQYYYMANIRNMNSYWLAVQYIPSADTNWVELRYDRDGRDIVFRIDLTGGGDQ